jgi:predicted RNase H-like HicB family nuclease
MAVRKKVFKIVLEPAEDTPTEWFVATSSNLRGLVTQGRGVDETIENVKDAIRALFKGEPPECTLEVKVLVPV